MSPANAPASADVKTARSSHLLRLLADSIPALVAYFARENLRCIFANKAYAHSFGLDEISVVGKTVPEIIGAEAFATIEPYIERAMQGETVRYERQNRLPDGSELTIEVTLIPHFDPSGKVTAAFVMINDITRHHEAEKAIRESEERLQKFADATTEGIVFIDCGTIVDCNEAVARMMRSTQAASQNKYPKPTVMPITRVSGNIDRTMTRGRRQ